MNNMDELKEELVIEVTREMVKAGKTVLDKYYVSGLSEEIVAEIYWTMELARPKIDSDGWLLLKEWPLIGTKGVQRVTDEHLLRIIENNLRLRNGWGLVAELMKRFERAREPGEQTRA